VAKYWLAWVQFQFLFVSKSILVINLAVSLLRSVFSSTSSEVDVAKRGGDQELEGDFKKACNLCILQFGVSKKREIRK